MRKTFKQLHLWISIPFGLLVTLICFSGAMLVFEQELTEAAYPDLYRVTPPKDKAVMPVNTLVARVAATLPDSIEVTGVTVSDDPAQAYKVSLSKPRRAAVMVDPYTGRVLGRAERPAFFAKMFGLHRWLLDSPQKGQPSVGKTVIGVTTIAFVLILLSGIVIWWPRTVRGLKESLKIPVKRGMRRFWYGLHVAGGMYALVFLLAMGLTGLTWSFGWYRTGFYALFGASEPTMQGAQDTKPKGEHDTPQHKGDRRPQGKSKAKGRDGLSTEGHTVDKKSGRADFTQWQKVLNELKHRHPGFKQITIQDGKANVTTGTYGNTRGSDRYEYDIKTGTITAVMPYAEGKSSQKLRGWIFSVHTGSFGGMTTRIIAFLVALLGASLPLTGYYLWLKRTVLRSKRRALP